MLFVDHLINIRFFISPYFCLMDHKIVLFWISGHECDNAPHAQLISAKLLTEAPQVLLQLTFSTTP